MSERATRHVAYQTEGKATYTITAMEDSGMLQSLTWLAAAGKVDFDRILIVRAASNFDQQRPGTTAAESLTESRVATHSAYRPALENAHRAGSCIAQALLATWPRTPAPLTLRDLPVSSATFASSYCLFLSSGKSRGRVPDHSPT